MPYHLTKEYRLTDNIMPLSKFELQFTAHTVSNVFKFYVEGSGGDGPATGGVYLRLVQVEVITTPLEASFTPRASTPESSLSGSPQLSSQPQAAVASQQLAATAAKTAAKRKAASPAGPSNPALDAVPEDGFASMGLQPAQMVQLYRNPKGQLVNETGTRVDSMGRPTRPRGAKGRNSRRWYERERWYDR